MNRTLTTFNLFGVLVLTGLSILQWHANRSLNLDINALEHTNQSQSALLEEQSHKLSSLNSDLDRFREQLGAATLSQKAAEEKLRASEKLSAQLSGERDQLNASITQWTTAVATRDSRLQEANDRIRELAAQINDNVAKYNALVITHNYLVKQVNEAHVAADAQNPASPAAKAVP